MNVMLLHTVADSFNAAEILIRQIVPKEKPDGTPMMNV